MATYYQIVSEVPGGLVGRINRPVYYTSVLDAFADLNELNASRPGFERNVRRIDVEDGALELGERVGRGFYPSR